MLIGRLQIHEGQIGPVDPDPEPPPLPGGAAEVVRFFMEVPQWIQIGGVFLGAIVAAMLAYLGWKHRRSFLPWVKGLPAAVKATALAVLVAGGAVASIAGYQVYDFVEHDNNFCTGCHLMADAFVSFEESAHGTLGCKDCHAQPKTESARQLYLWVLDRPQEVGPHSPVPDVRCTTCHVDGDPDDWPQIAASMGHRVHFESDDPDLGELMCVTCHGVSVHEFVAAETTCGECHEAEASIRLGRMAAETELHCVACHDFMAAEPTDLPGAPEGMTVLTSRAQCVACHAMEPLLVEGELDQDPHGAVCGACHNPHTQDTPFAAVETCIGCHEGVDTLTVFHTGTHAPALETCTECHQAHGWRVQGTQCLDCHTTIMGEVPSGELPSDHPSRAAHAGFYERSQAPVTSAAGPLPTGHPTPGGREGIAPLPPLSTHPRPEGDDPRDEADDGNGATVNGGVTNGPTGASGRPSVGIEDRAGPAARVTAGPRSDVREAARSRARLAVHGGSSGALDPAPRAPSGPGTPSPVHGSPAAAADTVPRPFLHREHETLSCLECHGTAEGHGLLTVTTPRDCAQCHHDPQRAYTCQACHASDALPARVVQSPMALTVWDVPRDRGLPFDHDLHGTLDCQDCHTGSVFLAVETTCAGCHADHHRPEAECSQCHAPAEPGVHGLEVHLTCSNSGCHAGTAGERPPLSRSLCLSCHVEQRDHEPGLECQSCHRIPEERPTRRGAFVVPGSGPVEAG